MDSQWLIFVGMIVFLILLGRFDRWMQKRAAGTQLIPSAEIVRALKKEEVRDGT